MKKLDDTIRENMLTLMHHCVFHGIVKNKTEWCEKVGILFPNLHNIMKGKQNFTHEHIYRAVKLAGADINYVYGYKVREKV